jgi:hypothetical protein
MVDVMVSDDAAAECRAFGRLRGLAVRAGLTYDMWYEH